MSSTNDFFNQIGLLSEEEVERRRQWRKLPPKCKEYKRGVEAEEHQEDFKIDLNIRLNGNLPVPPTSSRLQTPSTTQTPVQLSPPNIPENPNAYFPPTPKQFIPRRKNMNYQIYQKDRREFDKSRESTIWEEERTSTNNQKHLSLDPNTPFQSTKHPLPPKDLEQKAQEFYPNLHPFLGKLLYLIDDLHQNMASTAQILLTSQPQAEKYYSFARLIQVLNYRAQHAKTF